MSSAIVPLMDTGSDMLNALNIGADDGRKIANGMVMGMREFLFRGKNEYHNKWCFGDLRHGGYYSGDAEIYIVDSSQGYIINYPVIPETVGQFTGLTDKNGKKIFEGDICRFREWCKGEMCWIGKVYWEYQQFMISGGQNKECETMFELCMSRFIPENIEIIGNINDNPDLLKDFCSYGERKDNENP